VQNELAKREPSLTPHQWDGRFGDRSIRGKGPDLLLTEEQKEDEFLKCALSRQYFIDTYCWIEDKTKQMWLPFVLWPAQVEALKQMAEHDEVLVAKARRLGLTWLCLAADLWMCLFRPGTAVLFFSRTDKEAVALLRRFKDMHYHLPKFLQASTGANNDHNLEFPVLGSRAQAFASTKHSGRSYEATSILVDEADYIPVLSELLTSLKSCIEGGGRIRLVSSTNKDLPTSRFKTLARGAASGRNTYHLIFLPWTARPGRDQKWYDEQAASGTYDQDDMYHEFPGTLQEALAPRAASKRFRPEWLDACADVGPGEEIEPGFVVWVHPKPGREYVVAADPSEGNPHSDPSPAMVLDSETWEQCAVLYGCYEPDILAGRLLPIAKMFNNAIICPERNNHGHAVILALRNLDVEDLIYVSPHDNKHGWLSSPRWKVQALDNAAQAFRMVDVRIRDQATLSELMSIDARTLKAPPGLTDDLAMAMVIGLAALRWPSAGYRGTGESYIIEPDSIIEEGLTDGW